MAVSLLLGPILDVVGKVVDKIFPDATKAQEIKAEIALAAMHGEFDVELASIQAVNTTMQAEAKSEHWAQWLWRPVIGFTFAGILLNDYILMPYLQRWLTPINVPDPVWTAMLVILGASAAGRSFEKWQRNNNGKTG